MKATLYRNIVILVYFLFQSFQSFGQQAGDLDSTFNPGTGAGANSKIFSTTLQPDGKIIISGNFKTYNGVERNRIARLNADGSLDNTFNPGTGTNSGISSTTLQPDGKIIIVGPFSNYNGIKINTIARLNTNGGLDNTFNPGTGVGGWIMATVLQTDDKIIIGGDFNTYNGTHRNRIARLNTDGSLDTTFNPGTGANNSIKAFALQPDGKILIGGLFTSYNGIERNHIARLNADGSLDNTFNIGTGVDIGNVLTIAVQNDDKVVIGGNFLRYNGVAINNIARLKANGTLDNSFKPATGTIWQITSITLQPDGKAIIGGKFNLYNGIIRKRIARLNTNGSLDNTFNSEKEVDNEIRSISLQPDGKIIIGGDFNTYDGTSSNTIARIQGIGSMSAKKSINTPNSKSILIQPPTK